MPVAKGESKADKTGGYKLHAVSANGGLTPAKRAVAPYTQVKPSVAPSGMSQAGAKALSFRARKELSDVSTPSDPIAD